MYGTVKKIQTLRVDEGQGCLFSSARIFRASFMPTKPALVAMSSLDLKSGTRIPENSSPWVNIVLFEPPAQVERNAGRQIDRGTENALAIAIPDLELHSAPGAESSSSGQPGAEEQPSDVPRFQPSRLWTAQRDSTQDTRKNPGVLTIPWTQRC